MPDADAKQIIEMLIAVIEHSNVSTGYCCCGSSVDSHGMGDGHSPVDEGEYYAYQALQQAKEFLGL